MTELRQYAQSYKKGKTGCLTTVDEICALINEEMILMLPVTNLIFAGEAPDVLKLGDIVAERSQTGSASDLFRRPI